MILVGASIQFQIYIDERFWIFFVIAIYFLALLWIKWLILNWLHIIYMYMHYKYIHMYIYYPPIKLQMHVCFPVLIKSYPSFIIIIKV